MNGYGKFCAMIATSTVVMFGLMYLNRRRQADDSQEHERMHRSHGPLSFR
jgi:preprotein translocase subunit YajC